MPEVSIFAKIECLSETLFQKLRQTEPPIAKLAGWTLNLKTKKSTPSQNSQDCVSTDYSHFDPTCDDDLKAICRDFVRCAVYSIRRRQNRIKCKITTMAAEHE